MSCRTICRLAIMIGVGPIVACAAPPSSTTELCVVRPENNGFANLIPVELVLDGATVLTLDGGGRGCAKIAPGLHEVHLGWRWDPRDPRPEYVRSTPVTLDLPAGGADRDVCFDSAAPYPAWALAPAGTCRR